MLTKTTDKFVEMLRRSPVGQKIIKDDEREISAANTARATQLGQQRTKRVPEIERLAEEKATAWTEYQKALAATKTAKARWVSACSAMFGADLGAEQADAEIERELAAANKPVLDAFMARLRSEHDRINGQIDGPAIYKSEKKTSFWAFRDPTIEVTHDNTEAIRARLGAIVEAMTEAKRLAATKADIAADLEKIWDALPSAETMNKIKPAPRPEFAVA